MKHYIGNSDPLGDILGDMIAGEFQLREAQEQRRLEEHEYQSIRLELVIGYRQTLADLQTGNRRAEKKAKWRKTWNSDPLGGMIATLEFQLREAQEQRRLEEHEYQSIRLELVIGYRQTLADLQTGNRRAEKKAKWRKTWNSFCSDPLVFMGVLGDMIAGEFQLREAQEQRRLEEHEYQSIRLELVIGYRQTLADLQTGNRRAEKKAKWRKTIGEMLHMTKGVAPGKVGGQETEEEKISIVIDQLNKDIL
ncbi:hypothetical protein NHX12_033960, partial [Muraenolepis orangiensis]